MKKTLITFTIAFLVCFTAFGQSVTLTPTSSNQVSVRTYSTQKPIFSGYHSEGSASSPTATLNGRILTGLYGYGYVGNTFKTDPNASIEFKAVNNFSINNQGTEILFNTTRFNGTTPFERMRITDNGFVGVGTTTPQTIFEVRTPSDSYGIQHTNGTVTMGTFVGTASGEIGTRTNHPFKLYSNNNTASVILETDGKTTIRNSTKLGFDAPPIKQKLITGYNIPLGDPDVAVFIPHGLTANKILAVNIFIEAEVPVGSGDVRQVPPNYSGFSSIGAQYNYTISPNSIRVELFDFVQFALYDKPIRVFITYEE